MDAKDIELVAKITKEQEDWKKNIKAVETQVIVLLTTINKAATMCDKWWLDLAKQQALSGLSAAINAVSVQITEGNLSKLKAHLALEENNRLAQEAAAKTAQAAEEVSPPIEPSGVESKAIETMPDITSSEQSDGGEPSSTGETVSE